jgi:hypothetical protein
MAYGVILKHLEVDKITWGYFLKKNVFKGQPLWRERGARRPFFNWCGEQCNWSTTLIADCIIEERFNTLLLK